MKESIIKRLFKKSITEYEVQMNELFNVKYIIKYALILLLILFVIDISNFFSLLLNHENFIPLYIVLVILMIMKLLELKMWTLFSLKVVNHIDALLESILLAFAVYSVSIMYLFHVITYKIRISFAIVVMLYILILIRIYWINKKQEDSFKTNVYDLKDLCEGNIQLTDDNKLLLIKEKEVEYDLLERGHMIQQLYDLVINCHNEEKFVVALEGLWGSGKTTIINNLKKQLREKEDMNIIIIDHFDPWIYEDEKAMFRGMFEVMMKGLRINLGMGEINHFIKTYMDMIFSITGKEGVYKLLKDNGEDADDTDRLKKIINAHLKKNHLKVVFIIDNIERANKENILFLFKLMHYVLNFDNTIYIISFDDKRMKKIFNKSLETDYEYIKKIIQLEIRVPKIHKSVMRTIIKKCFLTLMKVYQVDVDAKELENIVNILTDNIADLRELKVLWNSIIGFNALTNHYLNFQDTLFLELIKRNDIELFEEIWNNKEFFISEDTHIFEELYTLNIDDFNTKAKVFFDKLFSNPKHNEFKDVLAQTFPYVKNYVNNLPCRVKYGQYLIGQTSNGDYQANIKSERIFNARYFELYFTQCSNEFTEINEKVRKFIDVINESENNELIENEFVKLMKLFPNWIQKYTFETFEYYLDNIKGEKKFLLLLIMMKHVKEYDDSLLFLSLSALQRIYIISAKLVLQINEKEFRKFINKLRKDYGKIQYIDSIIYWVNDSIDDKNKGRFAKLKIMERNLVAEIMEKHVDIYKDEYYFEKNSWAIYHAIDDNDKGKIRQYMGYVLNKTNIFRFLNDLLGRSTSNIAYGYSIRSKNIELFCSEKKVENILNNMKRELTEDEKLLKEIYEKSKNILDDESAVFLNDDRRFVV